MQAYQKFISGRHGAITLKPGSYKWIGYDRKENFVANKKRLKFYIDNPIEYNINNQLFRSKFNFNNLENKKVDIYLGCSHTFGTGHLWEHTWPYLVSQHSNNTIINLGVPGGGIETSYILLKKFITKFKVVNVFHYQPIYSRYHYYENGIHKTYRLTNESNRFNPFGDRLKKKYLIKDEIILHNHFRSVDACKGVCSSYNANYYHLYDWFNENTTNLKANYYLQDVKDLLNDIPARDLLHYPLNLVKKISNKFIEKLNE